jgi:peptide deformylase
MAVLPILRWPDPRLSETCAPVQDLADIQGLVADMLETMYAAKGRGLAAPQVGHLCRVFVIDIGWKVGSPDPLVMINPVLQDVGEDSAINAEGCLSIPGVTTDIRRPSHVRLQWTSAEGARVVQGFSGFGAVCVQHELDHLNGVVTFDHLDPDARAKAERDYQQVPV